MKKLLKWYVEHGRDLAWRKTKDPYKILVSEIMLQQTQVERVIPKYEVWLTAFPNWEALAAAPRVSVLKLWSGLGYNSRAVRLHALAKFVHEQLQGKFPNTEEELVKLPGIGPYTAGAIMTFAHNIPGKCIDVNIGRIVKRVYFLKGEVPSTKEVQREFLDSFPKDHARDWGNALMDFGSLICTAKSPSCDTCSIYKECKSKGERFEELRERKKRRQSTFLHSNRWWRGQILKRVAMEGGLTDESLLQRIIREPSEDKRVAFTAALEELKEELLTENLSVRED